MTDVLDAQYTEAPAQATAIAVAEHQPMALPMVTPKEASDAMARYLELCEAILTDDDYQSFWQWDPKLKRKVEKKFKKKSAVKKLQTFYAISTEILRETRHDLGDGHYGFVVIAKATAQNGKACEAEGACTTLEERFDLTPKDNETPGAFKDRQKKALARAFHDIVSTAGTRARNRAVMECLGLGGGEVTAEECRQEKLGNAPPPQNQRQALQKPEIDPEVQARNKRTAALLIRAKALELETMSKDIVIDGPTFLMWIKEAVYGCQDAAKGWKPTEAQLDAVDQALKDVEGIL